MKKKSIKKSLTASTENRLLNAGREEFALKGYYASNVDSITQRASVSHGTFYLYFKSKNELLITIIKELLDGIPMIAGEAERREQWLAFSRLKDFEKPVVDAIDAIADSSGLLRAFVQGMLQSKEVFDLFTQTAQQIAETFAARLMSLQDDGRYQDCDVRVVSQIMSVSLIMSIFVWSMGVISCSPRLLAKNIAHIFFYVLNFDEERQGVACKEKPGKSSGTGIFNKTRKNIIEAARQEFSLHGYFDTQIGNIAKKAGCSRGTFYQCFKGKDDLIQSVYEHTFDPLGGWGHRPENFIEHLHIAHTGSLAKFILVVIDIFESSGPLNVAFLQGSFFSDTLRQNYSSIFQRFSESIAKKIDMQKAKGMCQGVDSLITAQILSTTVSYATFFRAYDRRILRCSRNKFAINMGSFLHRFINF